MKLPARSHGVPPAAAACLLLCLLGCSGGDDAPAVDAGRRESASGEPAASPPVVAPATPALDEEQRTRIKRATALIRTAEGSGSGFALMHREAGLLVLTNAHVVPADEPEIEVVFDSGGPTETTLAARWLAADPQADLCLLEIDAAGDQREVLELAPEDALYETQPLLIAGFPFGDQLSHRGNPEPTLTTATVSSLHHSGGRLEQVQLDGDLNPGNSGGPIVDVDGRVAGVAVATVLATKISFMIPAGGVRRFLDGVVWQVGYEVERLPGTRDDDRGTVTLAFRLADPFGRITRVGVDAAGSQLASGSPVAGDDVIRLPLGERRLPARLSPWYENAAGRQALAPVRVELEPLPSPPPPPAVPPPPSAAPPPPPAPPPPAEPWPIPAAADVPPAERPPSGLYRELEPQPGAGLLERQLVAEVEDAVLERIEIDAEGLFGGFAVSPDGQVAVVAAKQGLLRRIALADLREQARLEIEAPIVTLASSKDGLLVLLRSRQELLILDWNLRPLGAIAVPGGESLSAASSSSLAFVATSDRSRKVTLEVIDVAARRRVMRFAEENLDAAFRAQIRRHDRSPPFGCGTMEVTPDGRYLLCIRNPSGSGIHRVALQHSLEAGGQLLYEEASPRLNFRAGSWSISADSRQLAVWVTHRHDYSDYPPISSGTFIFDVDDLRAPVLALEMSGAIAFTGDPRLPYAVGQYDMLAAFNRRGSRRRSVKLPRPLGLVRKLLPLPGDQGLWVLTDRALVSVRFK